MGHSGSSALVDLFSRHPQVRVAGYEPLDHGGEVKDHRWSAYNYTARLFATARASTLQQPILHQKFGFKMRPISILNMPEKWSQLVKKHRTRIFWNEDLNTLRSVLNHEVNAAVVCKLCEPKDSPLPADWCAPKKCSEAGSSALQFLLYNGLKDRKFVSRTLAPPLPRAVIDAVLPVKIRLDRVAARFARERGSNNQIKQAFRFGGGRTNLQLGGMFAIAFA